MPLPPALAAKLAKRGLVDEEVLKTSLEKKTRYEEEVIAENYDSFARSLQGNQEYSDEVGGFSVDKHFKGHPGCPNKWNVYHECTAFCSRHWGKGMTVPDLKYLRKQARLLAKYPLPSNWKEVYDPGTGQHYYWETSSDMVSWLPPGHPKAVVSESAATIREEKHLAATDDASDHESDSQEEDDDETEDTPKVERERSRTEYEPRRDRRPDYDRGRTRVKPNDLDPMDPASYSDIPRGRWSDGLDKGNEAKTGADTTAAGPLYQMRPYPSPGAILRANNASKSK